MHIILTGRRIELTEAMRAYAEKKLARLSKHYNRISEMEVVVDEEGLHHKVEIIVKADNHQRFVVNEVAEDAYACLDGAVDKIERQLTRHKEKSRDRKKRVGTGELAAEVAEAVIEDEGEAASEQDTAAQE